MMEVTRIILQVETRKQGGAGEMAKGLTTGGTGRRCAGAPDRAKVVEWAGMALVLKDWAMGAAGPLSESASEV